MDTISPAKTISGSYKLYLLDNLMPPSIEAPSYIFTPIIHTGHPYKNDPATTETYDAVEIPSAISIPLGDILLDTIQRPLTAMKASTETLSHYPGFDRHAQSIGNGITKIEAVPYELQHHHAIALTRGEFRFETTENEPPSLPQDETIIVEGERARWVRGALLDYANNGLAPVSGFAQLALRNPAAPQEVIESAQHILAESEQLHEDLKPLMKADVYVVIYERGQRTLTPYSYDIYPTPLHTSHPLSSPAS